MGVRVTLTVEAGNGEDRHVEAEGQTYGEAKAAAEALIPEGSEAIVLRNALRLPDTTLEGHSHDRLVPLGRHSHRKPGYLRQASCVELRNRF
jgi:hypothetical protein